MNVYRIASNVKLLNNGMFKMTKNKRVKGWIVIFALLVAVAGAELFCRLYLGLGDPPISISDEEIDYIFAPNQDCSRFGNTVIYNNLSMRCAFDLDIADKASRVFVVGDSVINGGVLTDQSNLARPYRQGLAGVQCKRRKLGARQLCCIFP